MDRWLMAGIPRTIAEDPDMSTIERIRASITTDTGQAVESSLLLPCPFCLGKPYIQTHDLGDGYADARVVCSGCRVSTAREYQSWRIWHGDDELTRTLAIGRAISSWNRRAVRTCCMIFLWSEFEDGGCYKCSDCGEVAFTHGSIPSYCPHCGAKVMGE